MSYKKHNFKDGEPLFAAPLNEMDAALEELTNRGPSESVSWNDLTDRPFYEEGTGAVIEWDGNTEGRDQVTLDGVPSHWYKVSDLTPTEDELSAFTIEASDGTVYTSEFVGLGVGENMLFAQVFAVFYNTEATFRDGTFNVPSTGIYFMNADGMYVAKFSYGSTTIKKLDEKFVPDSIARVSDIPEFNLPVGGDALGGVRNGGNVVINEDGTMTVPSDRYYNLYEIGKRIIEKKYPKIVLMGDSITDGYGGTDYTGSKTTAPSTNTTGYCWANVFKKYIEAKFGIPVENIGMFGSQANEQVEQAMDYLTGSELVIWLSGTNARVSVSSFTDYCSNIGQYIGEVQNRCADLVVMSCIPETEGNAKTRYMTTTEVCEVLVKEATGKTYFFDMRKEFIHYCETFGFTIDSMLLDDGMHPNDTCYWVMFKLLCENIGIPLSSFTSFKQDSAWWWEGFGVFPDHVAECDSDMIDGKIYVIHTEIPAGTITKVKVNAESNGPFKLYFADKNDSGKYVITQIEELSVSKGVNVLETNITVAKPCYLIVTGDNIRYHWETVLPDYLLITQLKGSMDSVGNVLDVYIPDQANCYVGVWVGMAKS